MSVTEVAIEKNLGLVLQYALMKLDTSMAIMCNPGELRIGVTL